MTRCVRCECSDWLTCVPKPAGRVLRRQIGVGASSLNRPFSSLGIRLSSYPRSSNLCSEAVVDWLGKTWIFIQCSCLIAPLRCEEPGCSFQTLEGRPRNGYSFSSVWLLLSLRSITASGAVGMTMELDRPSTSSLIVLFQHIIDTACVWQDSRRWLLKCTRGRP